MLTFLLIAGGVALLVFATRYMREGLDRILGDRLGTWMQHVARKPVRGFFAGIGASVLTQSSTTMSMLAVDVVQAGHLTTRQMMCIMLGADIGLTLTVQLIALSLHSYAPVIILVGVILMQFTNTRNSRGIGQITFSLGLLFLSVQVIKNAVAVNAPGADFIKLLEILENYPMGMALLAACMAFALQSSTATIGLVMSLAANGGLHAAESTSGAPLVTSLGLAIPVVCGANIGVALTTFLVGFRRVESRRLGLANLFAKTATAILLLTFLGPVVALVQKTPGHLPQQVANCHTGFNVLMALIFLPFIGPLCYLVEMFIPAPPEGDKTTFGPRYIQNGPFDGATLAMAQSAREIMFAAEIVRSMLEDLWRAMKTNDEDLVRQIAERDNQVDLLDAEIKKFLAKLSAQHLDADEIQEQLRQLRYLAELESIGDIIDKNLCRLVKKKIKLGLNFTAETWRELDDFDKKVLENMLLADTAFQTRDRELAEKLLRHKDHIDLQIRQLRDAHFARFSAETEAQYETSAIQLDLLTNLKRINSHVSHVAYAVIHGCDYPSASTPSTATN